jgi:hypothetical protein
MQKNKKHMVGCHSKFRHDLPTNKTDAESQFFVEMEMNQHFAKKSATHFQVINFQSKTQCKFPQMQTSNQLHRRMHATHT